MEVKGCSHFRQIKLNTILYQAIRSIIRCLDSNVGWTFQKHCCFNPYSQFTWPHELYIINHCHCIERSIRCFGMHLWPKLSR